MDGLTVLGEITHRSHADLEVCIQAPYQNLRSSCHVPYFARMVADFRTERGDGEARRLLRNCYDLGRFVEAHFVQLQQAWQRELDLEAAVPLPAHYGRDAFLSWRKELKAALKEGRLTPIDFQKALGERSQAHKAYEQAQWARRRAFEEGTFPDELIDCELLRQVTPLLEGRLSLLVQ